MTAHAPVFYCPYCGEEDIRPHDPALSGLGPDGGKGHGQWECAACRRVYAVKFLGLKVGAQ